MTASLSIAQRRRYERPEEHEKLSVARKEWHEARRSQPDYRDEQSRRSALGTSTRGGFLFTDRWAREHWMKSDDERRFAHWLDQHNLTWWYEPHVLELGAARRYIPDFLVQEWGSTYIELHASHLALHKKTLEALRLGYSVLALRGLKKFFDWLW